MSTPHTPYSEKQAIRWELLALRCRRGDENAFAELVREWERPLVYYVRRLLGDGGAEWDVLQEVWLRAFRGIGSLREPRALPVWLYRIAHHVVMRHLRGKYADPAAEAASDFDAAEVAIDERLHFTPGDAELVHRALGKLPVPFREVLTLHFLEGMTVQQVAEVLGVPPGTVKSRLYHAKRALRALLEREDKP
jgi:RNA polymerase sigma factor (sigma-70 family)